MREASYKQEESGTVESWEGRLNAPVPLKSPGSATIINVTSVPPSLAAHESSADCVNGLDILAADILGPGAGAAAVISAHAPANSKVDKVNGMSCVCATSPVRDLQESEKPGPDTLKLQQKYDERSSSDGARHRWCDRA